MSSGDDTTWALLLFQMQEQWCPRPMDTTDSVTLPQEQLAQDLGSPSSSSRDTCSLLPWQEVPPDPHSSRPGPGDHNEFTFLINAPFLLEERFTLRILGKGEQRPILVSHCIWESVQSSRFPFQQYYWWGSIFLSGPSQGERNVWGNKLRQEKVGSSLDTGVCVHRKSTE